MRNKGREMEGFVWSGGNEMKKMVYHSPPLSESRDVLYSLMTSCSLNFVC